MHAETWPEMITSGLPLLGDGRLHHLTVTPDRQLDIASRTHARFRAEKVTLRVDLLLRARKAEEASPEQTVAQVAKGNR